MKDKYNLYIYNKYKDLLNAKKLTDLDNKDLCKIFEYYSCIKLTEEYKTFFYEYADIDPEFKEENQMTKNDTGIDCSNLIDTIVQCKLRKDTLTWKDCATTFGSMNMYDEKIKDIIVRWKKLIITRNNDCKLSKNLKDKYRLFIDKAYNRDELIKYCEELLIKIPLLPIVKQIKKVIRDYQQECIDLIINSNENVIISLPTGTGKNFIIVNSLQANKKYLILVPRIILLEQIQNEIIEHNPKLKNKIQLIGDSNNNFNENKDITICVYNSVKNIEEHSLKFYKIFIDEAHHINKPEIYTNDEEDDIDDEDINDEDDEDIDNENIDNEAELNKDNDDEINDKSTYIDIINNFTNLNNNVYLSATIDEKEGFKYYEKNIREMINKKYLCDYTINIPVFTDDPTNKNICEYLLKEYRNIIIYCNSQKEGKNINDLLNKLQKKSSEYIDCNTPKKKRKEIIEKYKSSELPFLVNVRILVEGFDAPITKGVCFMHLPSSKTTLIQIIGRALRLNIEKTYATIILPFSSKEDETSITNFMKIMAKNDSRIKKSFENKKLGGYISIEKQNDKDNEKDITDINFKYDLVFNSMGIMKNSEEVWVKRLEEVKKYIDENGKRPSKDSKIREIKSMGNWVSLQKTNYKIKKSIMSITEIYKKWYEFINNDKYKIYFLSNEEEWINNLEKVKKYIDYNNKIPPRNNNKDKYITKLYGWIGTQLKNYKYKKEIMSKHEIYKKWTDFINDEKYKKYFMTIENEDKWKYNLNALKKYIDENNERPQQSNKDNNIKKLCNWIFNQHRNYIKKIQIMSNIEIYNLWTEFINDEKYKKYFISYDDIWNLQFVELKTYIDNNKNRPSQHSENDNIKKLGGFISRQHTNYNKKRNSMSNPEIYKKWTEFINDEKYKKYFMINEEEWKYKLDELKNYINKNNNKPSVESKIPNDVILGNWITVQQRNYISKTQIMSNPEIYNLWIEFINNEKYKSYFMSNEDIWYYQFNELKKYIDANKRRPSQHNKNNNIKKLAKWISHQSLNYSKQKNSMSNQEIYKLWTEFINDKKYKPYFI